MLLHTLGDRIARDLGRTIESNLLNTGEIILRWITRTLPDGYDRNVEATYPAETPHELTVKGLIHYVNAATRMVNFLEFQAGDAIVTFDSDVVIDGLEGLTFELPDGRIYVPSVVGKQVTEFWDVTIGGEQLSRTISLRQK